MLQWPALLPMRREPDESARSFDTWKIPARIRSTHMHDAGAATILSRMRHSLFLLSLQVKGIRHLLHNKL